MDFPLILSDVLECVVFLSVAIPSYKGPYRKTARSRVGTLYSIYTEKLRLLIPKLGFIALTSDL
jgi:hypothetical protein